MSKRARIVLGSILGLLILIVVASFIANPIIQNKIKKTITNEIPENFQINDYEVSVDTFGGSVSIENFEATLKDTIGVFKDAQISLRKASVSGLSYWKYLFLNKIAVDDITLFDLHIKAYRDTTQTGSTEKQQKDFKENISAGKFTLENASFLFKNTDESVVLQMDSLNFSLKNIVVNETTLQEKIPFYFSEMEVDTRDFLYEINENEVLSLKEFSIKNQQLKVTDVTFQTKIDSLKLNEETTTDNSRTELKIPSLTLSDISFEVVDDAFQLFGENLEIDKPSVQIQKGFKEVDGKTETVQTAKKKKKEMPLPFSLTSVYIKDAKINVINPDETTNLQVENFNLTLKDFLVNTASLQQKIPALFSDLEIKSNVIQYQLNDYDLLSLKALSLENNNLQIEDVAIKTLYSKTELSKLISKERDYIDAEMPMVTLRNFDFEVLDTTFQVSAGDFIIENPVLKVYRDKLVRDDTSIKPLYSKAIRDIPFPLTIDSLHIKNATILYEEKVNTRQGAGAINFSMLNAAIGNFSNTYAQGEKKTTIKISSIFMDESLLTIDWSFDINDLKDTFHIQGELDALNATKMNSFSKASLNVTLEGKVNKIYFNIHGNDEASSVDLRISYDNFKVEILNKENKRNWFLSTVANIFVKKKSDTAESTFKEGNATAQRNRDKSFFNYLWINIQEGLKDVMVAI